MATTWPTSHGDSRLIYDAQTRPTRVSTYLFFFVFLFILLPFRTLRTFSLQKWTRKWWHEVSRKRTMILLILMQLAETYSLAYSSRHMWFHAQMCSLVLVAGYFESGRRITIFFFPNQIPYALEQDSWTLPKFVLKYLWYTTIRYLVLLWSSTLTSLNSWTSHIFYKCPSRLLDFRLSWRFELSSFSPLCRQRKE